MYVLGCSLVHATMLIVMFFIAWPDLEEARKLDEQLSTSGCSDEA
jgi:hypothetical protein